MFTRMPTLLALLLFAASCGKEPTSHVEPETSTQTVGAVEGIDGTLFRYDEGLYRGGDITSQEGMDELKKLGVATVFAVTPTDEERNFAAQSSIRLVEVPFTKEGIAKETLPTYVELLQNAEQPIYVHCHSGKNRGGTLLAAYRVHVQNWSIEEARAEFVALGGNDTDYPELMESIRKQ